MSSNEDIQNIEDINVLQEIYEKESKEAKELEKKLELIVERFTMVLEKIKSLRHLHENKSEEKEDVSNNEPIEKPVKKTKKLTNKHEQELQEKEYVKLEEIEKEEEPLQYSWISLAALL
jgi:hypothetical protein